MTEQKPLKIVVQAVGLYCAVQSAFLASGALARMVSTRVNPEYGESSIYLNLAMKTYLIENFVHATLLLLIAWLLLAKAIWWANTLDQMSRPHFLAERDDNREQEELLETQRRV